MKLNILGSEWTIEYRNVDIDPILQDGERWIYRSVY